MKRTLRKTIRRQKRSLKNLSALFSDVDYTRFRLQQEQYLHNMLATNKRLQLDYEMDNLILY